MVRSEQLDIEDIAKVFVKKEELSSYLRGLINNPDLKIFDINMVLNILRNMEKDTLLDFICIICPELLNTLLDEDQIELQKLISECLKLIRDTETSVISKEVYDYEKEKFSEAILIAREGLVEGTEKEAVLDYISNLEEAKDIFLENVLPELDPKEFSEAQLRLYNLINDCYSLYSNTNVGLIKGCVFERDKTEFGEVIVASRRGLTSRYSDDLVALNNFYVNLTEAKQKFQAMIISDEGFIWEGKFYGLSNEFNPDSNKYEWVPLAILADKYWISMADIPYEIKEANNSLIHVYGEYDYANKIVYTFFDLPNDLLDLVNDVVRATCYNRCVYGPENHVNAFYNKDKFSQPYTYVNCDLIWHEADLKKNFRSTGYYIVCKYEQLNYFPTSKKILEKVFNAKSILAYEED